MFDRAVSEIHLKLFEYTEIDLRNKFVHLNLSDERSISNAIAIYS